MNVPTHIDALIAKFLQGEALPNEAMELEDWCQQHDFNREYFNEICNTMSLIDGLERKVPQTSFPGQKMKIQNRLFTIKRVAIAATFVGILTLAFWMVNRDQSAVIVAGGKSLRHHLPDQTLVELSPGAELSLVGQYNRGSRTVKLKGKASFNVIHDEHNKFVVDAGDVFVEDLGTRFSINANPLSDTLYVVVTEGVVRLYDDEGNEIIVKAGQSAWYIRSSKQIIASPETRVVRFDFDKTRLAEIARLLEETYQIRIELQPMEIGDCKLTTRFFDEEIATIMTIICETLDFSYAYQHQTYTIKGKPCQ